jgi:hypothetical protein
MLFANSIHLLDIFHLNKAVKTPVNNWREVSLTTSLFTDQETTPQRSNLNGLITPFTIAYCSLTSCAVCN